MHATIAHRPKRQRVLYELARRVAFMTSLVSSAPPPSFSSSSSFSCISSPASTRMRCAATTRFQPLPQNCALPYWRHSPACPHRCHRHQTRDFSSSASATAFTTTPEAMSSSPSTCSLRDASVVATETSPSHLSSPSSQRPFASAGTQRQTVIQPRRHQRQRGHVETIKEATSIKAKEEEELRQRRWRQIWQRALDERDLGQLMVLWHIARRRHPTTLMTTTTENSIPVLRFHEPDLLPDRLPLRVKMKLATHTADVATLHVAQMAAYIAMLRKEQKEPAQKHDPLFRRVIDDVTSWCLHLAARKEAGDHSRGAQTWTASMVADLIAMYARWRAPFPAFQILRVASIITGDPEATRHPEIVSSMLRLCWHTQDDVLCLAIIRDELSTAGMEKLREEPERAAWLANQFDDTFWGCLITILIYRRQHDAAYVFERFVQRHAPSRQTSGFFSWILHAYARQSNMRETVRVFRIANETLGEHLDVRCFNALLRVFAVTGDAHGMEQVWKNMHARRLRPDLASFTIFLHGYIQSDQPRMLDDVEKALERHLKAKASTMRKGRPERSTNPPMASSSIPRPLGEKDHVWMHAQWKALIDAEEWQPALGLFNAHWAVGASSPLQFDWIMLMSCTNVLKTLTKDSMQLEGPVHALVEAIKRKVAHVAAAHANANDAANGASSGRQQKLHQLFTRDGFEGRSGERVPIDTIPNKWRRFASHGHMEWFIAWSKRL